MDNRNVNKELEYFVESINEIELSLSEWLNDENIFKILGISRTEIRHSNYISYLINPNNGYKWNDKFFKKIMKTCLTRNSKEKKNYFKDIEPYNFNDINVIREYKNFDIFIKSRNNKTIVCIENKVDSTEHSNQLTRYYEYIEKEFPEYSKIFIYLTINGEKASNNNWISYSYKDLEEDILATYNSKEGIPNNLIALLDDYLKLIRRDIMLDEELIKTCSKIYFDNKEVLDLVYNNRINVKEALKDLIEDILIDLDSEDIIIYKSDYSPKDIVRFRSKLLDEKLPKLGIDYPTDWGYNYCSFYEINVLEDKLNMSIAFNNKIPNNLKDELEENFQKLDVEYDKNRNWNNILNSTIELDNDLVDICILNEDELARGQCLLNIKSEICIKINEFEGLIAKLNM
ncbi:MAG: PD-(D/E)XK nuclease family protein [Erysipelotrichales bacterium]